MRNQPPLSLALRSKTGREYAAADFRWGTADPTVVSLEILTVLGAGPMCFYILKQLVNDDPARHYWIIVLSTAELYGPSALLSTCHTPKFLIGGWMTFCPEWVSGSNNLDTSNALFLWVYLVVRRFFLLHCLPLTRFFFAFSSSTFCELQANCKLFYR